MNATHAIDGSLYGSEQRIKKSAFAFKHASHIQAERTHQRQQQSHENEELEPTIGCHSEFLRVEQGHNEVGHHQHGDSEHDECKNAHKPATSAARMRVHTAAQRQKRQE
jgi:hypothetical protein